MRPDVIVYTHRYLLPNAVGGRFSLRLGVISYTTAAQLDGYMYGGLKHWETLWYAAIMGKARF